MKWPAKRNTTDLTLTQIALGLLDRPPPLLSELSKQVSRRQDAVAELESRIRGDDSVFEFAADSLQARLLAYFETHFDFKRGHAALREAEDGRKARYVSLQREALLGLHSGNKELRPLVRGFSNYDLYVLNNAVIADDRPAAFKSPALWEIFPTQFKAGRGENLITYVARRLEHQNARMKFPKSARWTEIFHPALAIAVGLWTCPSKPLWMMPSAGAVSIINGLLKRFAEKPLQKNNFDTLIRSSKLPRLPTDVLSKLISVGLEEPVGIALRRELVKVMGIELASIQRGARRRTSRTAISTKSKKTIPLNSKTP